jgi:hypothetical protein
LANDAQPLAFQGTNAITVATDNTRKQVTIGENHSARTDNPHGTTAAQLDTLGGANQLVTQINAGTGIIGRARLESAVVSGSVTFQNLAAGIEMFSNDIDPGFGTGALCVDLALDDLPAVNLTISGDTNYARAVQFRAEINRGTGRFRIFATRNIGSQAATVTVRWYAFKPQAGTDTNIGVGIVVAPGNPTLISNVTQTFTATVTNTSNTAVTWSVTEANGGTLSGTTPTSTTYSPPGISGTYHVVATSVADPTKKATAIVVVNADITVTLNTTNATVIRGATQGLSATVVNTPITGVTWSIAQGAAGGSLSATTGGSVTYTAPQAPGTYTVVATSTADATKKATCTITVPAVSISITPDSSTVTAGSSTVIRASITGSSDTRANWTLQSPVPSISPALGATTTFFAPGLGGVFTVNASAVADPSKTASTVITVPNVKNPTGEGGGKFAPVLQENIATQPPVLARALAPDEQTDTGEQAQSFVRPKKRSSPKLPPEPSDG